MILFLQILLVITSLALIALILLHRGKGGGLSSLFGGTMQSSLSGSSVVEKNLDRLTLFIAASRWHTVGSSSSAPMVTTRLCRSPSTPNFRTSGTARGAVFPPASIGMRLRRYGATSPTSRTSPT